MKHFFDVGANIGQTFDDFLLKGDGFDRSTIWCFEPSPRHISQLRERLIELAKDEVHKWIIKLCPFGLTFGDSLIRMEEKNDPRGDSFFKDLYLQGKYIDNAKYKFIDISCWAMDAGLMIQANTTDEDRVTVKIDTEGSEFSIIKSILNRPTIWPRIDCLMVEWHSTDSANGREKEQEELQNQLGAANIRLEGWQY